MKKKLIKAHALIASLAGDDNAKAPEWIVLFAEGEGEVHGASKFLSDEESFALMTAYIAKRGIEIVFDYEHQTLNDVKAPAAGWIKDYRYSPGRGIEAQVEWTEEAAAFIAKKEYRYFSPVFWVRDDKRIVGLHSVALTNSPRTNNLTPLLAKLGAQYKPEEQEEDMKLKQLLIAAFKLDTGASDEDIIAAVNKAQADAAKEPQTVEIVAKDILSALDLKEDGDASAVVASIHALKQQPKGMVSKADFDALLTKLDERDAGDAVVAALKAGKITPDQKDWATDYAKTDLKGFTTFVAKAPVVVPVDDLPSGDAVTAKQDNSGAVALGAAFGNSEEDIKTYGG